MKRGYCLYRVSTKKQVDKNQNDIPMQRTACRDFASSKPDWMILKEFSEKGISGYKVSANDRIGRIDDETPFVVEWFAKHGIEVWSSQEGQQRFDNHVDKLMNYLRYWQASGESEKTSIRIKNKMQQMMLDGLYTGGPVKYGYSLADSGLVNRKGQPIKKYVIDPADSRVVQMIDEMTIRKGYGSWRMANFLNKNGYKTNTGGKFTSIKIIRILKDPYYCGRLDDDSTSEKLAALRIRSDETYEQIRYILEQRQSKNEEKRHIALQTKGQSTYQADRVDEVVRQIIRRIFSCMDGAPEEEKLQALFKRQMAGNRATQKKLDLELTKNREQLTKLQLEIGKTLTGDSIYSPEDLTQAIQTIRSRIAEAEEKLAELKAEEEQKKRGIDLITPTYNQFKSWADEFDTATLEQKKMIACHLFKRIEIGRDYKISVELNMSYQQFCSEWSEGRFFTTAATV